MKLIRRRFLSLAGAAVAAPAVSRLAWSQAYPTRQVRVVVMLAAGGGTDFLARLTGEYVSRGLGQQMVVENRTGAGGTIGIESVSKSTPDGYTVLFSNDNIASAPQILKVSGDYLKDLVPVIFIARQPLVWAVHQKLGISTMAEFIAAMKKSPGQGYATSGVGSNQHFLGEWFIKEAGLKMAHVPYKGAGQAVNDLIAAHVPIACLGPTSLMPHFENKTLRFLAQSSETRSATLPDIPTFQEAGLQGHGARSMVRRVRAGRNAEGRHRATERRIRQVADRSEGPREHAQGGERSGRRLAGGFQRSLSRAIPQNMRGSPRNSASRATPLRPQLGLVLLPLITS